MLRYIVRCFGWSAFVVSIHCVWENQPTYGIYMLLMAFMLLNMEFEDEEQNRGKIKMVKDSVKYYKDGIKCC